MKEYIDYLADIDPREVYRSHASSSNFRNYLNLESDISVRNEFTTDNYYAFRPSERIPRKYKGIIKSCINAYNTVGIIKNVIDLMGDFASQGITINHKNKRIQNFYRRWWKQVNGEERSERFLNILYRTGNVIITREVGKLTKKERSDMSKAYKNVVPVGYKYHSPLAVNVIGGASALFTGNVRYKLKISDDLREAVDKNDDHLSKLSDTLKRNIKEDSIILDPENTLVFHYKKDDWQLWAHPMIYAILDDIKMFEKMKLGDMAAMDGAISNIRLWTLGDLEQRIFPKKEAFDKLNEVLSSSTGNGVIDIVWGPELKFTESASQVHHFLGEEKYRPVLNSIYIGLGISSSLLGVNSGGGFTNNFISLKTLIDRLEYGRSLLRKFWEHEIALVQKAMGFPNPAVLHFDTMLQSNETAEKNLLVQLADRNIISYETIRDRLGEMNDIEDARIEKEFTQREKERKPEKADPFHKPESQLNPEQKGRQFNTPDKTKRKQKEVKPKTSPTTDKNIKDVTSLAWGMNTYKKISDVVQGVMTSYFEKPNLRSFTRSEFKDFEDTKYLVLCTCDLFDEITEEEILHKLENLTSNTKAMNVLNDNREKFLTYSQREPNTEEDRFIAINSFLSLV